MDKINLNHRIGKRLKQIREQQRLSLEKAAELTNVSKPMLGQIERGESNPTVSTLWKIANGLGVGFSRFIEDERPKVKVVSRHAIEPLKEDQGRFQVIPLFTLGNGQPFEWFSVQLKPDCSYTSEAHTSGVEEYILVEEGEIEIIISDESYHLKKGEAIRFAADCPHQYNNSSDSVSRVMMMIHYS
ncbi:helix-turn-helix domain-containing protein [Desertibacillus haloalkaliphilus]|uniref:helix-turn-helix domain-containing protein n=1 Tax=Desertibacillus haloalkaliphilus TaxID=1328930 RepID=UPI001C280E94|nr:helix-turn-helix transcriptional regulator [Desertibacillus haloalkaliphilus]MBU8908357.1 helix-turn-helix domain-containing protein [Desertibacillus haloalkaliphilus]